MQLDKDYYKLGEVEIYNQGEERMSEPAIVGYGRQFIEDFSVQEYKDSFIRSFRDRRANCVFLDDNPRGQKFVAAAIAWALDERLLFNDRNADDGQQVVSSFRLTKKGKKEILGR